MAYSGENEDFSWPMSGQDGPDFEWEHVPFEIPVPIEIPPISPISSKELPSVKGIQLGGEDTEDTEEEKPLPKVRTFERYNPSPEELKALPDNLDEIFDKHGDELIIQDDENGKSMHIYFLFGEYEGKKHYKCIKRNCNSFLIVEEISEPSPPPTPKEDEQKGKQEDHKEHSTEKEDEQKGKQEDHKGNSKEKKRKFKKKSKKSKKTTKEGNPQEEPEEK